MEFLLSPNRTVRTILSDNHNSDIEVTFPAAETSDNVQREQRGFPSFGKVDAIAVSDYAGFRCF